MSIISRLRKSHPYLTAPFNPDAEDENAIRPFDPTKFRMNMPTGVESGDEPPSPVYSNPNLRAPISSLPAVPDLSATDYYQQNRAIRPKVDPSIQDPYARMQDYESNLMAYQPQKESKKHLLLRTGLNFLAGGIPGAAATAIGGALDRRGVDRNWQAQEEERASNVIGRMSAERRARLQEDLMRSQIGENQAQAERAMRQPIAKPEGFTLGEGQARYDAQGNLIASGPNKPIAPRAGFTLGEGQVRYDAAGNPIATGPAKPQVNYGTRAEYFYKRQHEKESEAQDLEQQIAAIKPSAVDLDGNAKYSDQEQAKVNRLTQQRQAALNAANNLRTQGDNASTAKGAGQQAQYSGRTMSKASLAKYASDHGMTVDDARQQIEGMGIQIR